ncbi:MAG: hypothetical protein LDL31_06060 [Prosthecobacter sp.]|nr:hypothetical protein [Prosthecobacter sp.]
MRRLLPALAATLSIAAAEAPSRLSCLTHWLGNTLPGAAGHVPQDIAAIHVTPDGTVYTNVPWEEGGANCSAFRDGRLLGKAGHTHGWGQMGGRAVTANSRYVFIGQQMHNEGGGLKDPETWPPKGRKWFGVSRRLREDFSRPAPFEGGKGGKGDTLPRCYLPIVELADAEANAHLPGLAASEDELFVSHPLDQEIQVLDVETMRLKRSWKVSHPGPLQLDAQGRLWVLHRVPETDGDQGVLLQRLTCFTPEGVEVTRLGFDDEGLHPAAFAVHPVGRVFVANAAPGRANLVGFRLVDGKREQAGSIGTLRGIHDASGGAKPGTHGDLRFHRPVALGFDAAGGLYVAHGGASQSGSTVLEAYQTDLSLAWRVHGITFVDMADADPADDTQVFTKEERFLWHPGKRPGESWSYAATTYDPERFPDDPRTHIWSAGAWVRRIEGQRFLFVTEMNGGPLQVYRFEEASETAIPCALYSGGTLRVAQKRLWPQNQPPDSAWLWRAADGDGGIGDDEFEKLPTRDPEAHGWWVDERGGLWRPTLKSGILHLPCGGIDPKGVPRWSLAQRQTQPHPAELDRVQRLRYLPASDVMLLSGSRGEHKNQHWKPMGPVLVCYDRWSGERALRWQKVLPYIPGSARGHESAEPASFDVAGDYAFVVYSGRSKDLGQRWGHVDVLRLSDGKTIGFLEPDESVGEIGLQDLRESITARRRADGSYQVFSEDDAKAKVVLYHWKP